MFHIARCDALPLIQCMRGLRWEEVGAEQYESGHALLLYCKA